MSNTTPTTKAEAMTEARQALNRAGYVFINPPPRAMEICLDALVSADKALKSLEARPVEVRLGKTIKAFNKVAYKFEHLAQVRLQAGYIEDAKELTSVGHHLHLVGIDLIRTFHPTK